jgi:hypothetical protein
MQICQFEDRELALVRDCVRAFLDLVPPKTLTDRIDRRLDWVRAIEFGQQHRLLAIIYQVLLEGGCLQELPLEVREKLVRQQQKTVRRSLQLTAETLHLVKNFDRAGICTLPLKGPLLAWQLYGDLSLRSTGDIDLAIAPTTYPKAKEVLRDLGYCYRWDVCETWSEDQETTYLKQQGEITWIHPSSKIAIDLHLRWNRNVELFPLKFDRAWKSATWLSLQPQAKIRVLAPEYQVLYLSIHGANHRWSRWLWLVDLAALTHPKHQIDWQQVWHQAAELHSLRSVAQGLQLVSQLFGVEITTVWHDCCQTSAVQYLVSAVTPAITNSKPEPLPGDLTTPPLSPVQIWRELQYVTRLQSRWRYKLSCITRLLFSAKDWQVLPLPNWLSPLYIILRPLFYVYRWIRHKFSWK